MRQSRVDAVVTALVLAVSRRSVSAPSQVGPVRLRRGACALVARCETDVVNGAETCVRVSACTRAGAVVLTPIGGRAALAPAVCPGPAAASRREEPRGRRLSGWLGLGGREVRGARFWRMHSVVREPPLVAAKHARRRRMRASARPVPSLGRRRVCGEIRDCLEHGLAAWRGGTHRCSVTRGSMPSSAQWRTTPQRHWSSSSRVRMKRLIVRWPPSWSP
jgi:hypothetical protein